MGGIGKSTLFGLFVFSALLVQTANAGLFDSIPYYGCSGILGAASSSITADRSPCKAEDAFADTCHVPRHDIAAGLGCLSVQTSDGGTMVSFCWTATSSPVAGLDFLFGNVADGNDQSAFLRFASGGSTVPQRQPAVLCESTYSGGFTWPGAAADAGCIMPHGWCVDF